MHPNMMKLQKPSQGDGFWVGSAKTAHRESGFETHTYRRQLIAEFVCMFQNPFPCEGFFKTPLHVRVCGLLSLYVCMCVKGFTGRGVLKKPHRQRGFEKA